MGRVGNAPVVSQMHLLIESTQAMSKNLVDKGKLNKPVTFWNRTHNVASQWAAIVGPGAKAVEDLIEAIADADIVWSCLSTQDAVISCFDRILETNVKGKLFVESSTVTPEASNRLAERLQEAGAEFISMPGTKIIILLTSNLL